MKRTLLYTIVFCLASSLPLQAQLQKEDMQFLEQVSAHYANGYQMEVMVYAFPVASAQAMVLDSCFTARQQDNMIITTRNYDVLQSADYTLTANHLNKEIYLVSNQKSTRQATSNKFEFSAEELKQSRALFSTRSEGQHLLFEATELEVYDKVVYHFDKATYALTMVVYDYADSKGSGTPDKVEIHYRNVFINQPLSKETFDLKRYVSLNNGAFAVNEEYQAYQLNQNL